MKPTRIQKAGHAAIPAHAHYPLPWAVGVRLAWSALRGDRRSFSADARLCTSLLDPPMQVLGIENLPSQGPFLLTANHYSRTGFQAFWIPLAISACVPYELHWVMTDAWRFEGHLFANQLERLTRWVFRRVANAYGFTSMPSMPPRKHETEARSQAVRHLLRYAQQNEFPAIGLVPEGYDMPGGLLGRPPTGVGRLTAHLLPYTQRILPAGVYETQGRLCVRFGETYTLDTLIHAGPQAVDRLTSDAVMSSIALLLPSHLRGAYS